MSGGWHGTSRHAAALLALATRCASHAAASTSSTCDGPAARQLLQCGGPWLRQAAGRGSGNAWSGVRGVSASAARAAETLLQEVDEAEERHNQRQHQEPSTADPQQVPRTAGEAQLALLTALQQYQDKAAKQRKGRFSGHLDADEMHYSLASLASYVHETDEDRAHYFRQWARQIDKETTVLREAVREYEEATAGARERQDAASMGPSQDVMRQWYPAVTKRIQQEQEQIMMRVEGEDRNVYGPYFCLLEPKYLAVIAINYTLNMILSESRRDPLAQDDAGRVNITQLSSTLGKAVQQQVHLEQLKKQVRQDNQRRRDLSRLIKQAKELQAKLEEKGVAEFSPWDADSWRQRFSALGETLPEDVKDWFKDDSDFAHRAKQLRNRWALANPFRSKGEAARDLKRHASIALGTDAAWRPDILVKVGAKLIDMLVESAYTEMRDGTRVQSFRHQLLRERKGKHMHQRGYLVADPEVLRLIEENEEIAKTAFPKFKPMLVPPAPWRSASTGAHLTMRSFVMRTREQQANRKLLEAADREMAEGKPGASQVYKALNVLGNLGWCINVPVLDVAQRAWERGGEIAGLPTRNVLPTMEMPALPNCFRTAATPTPGYRRGANQLTAQWGPPSPIEVRNVRWEVERARKLGAEQFSQRCDLEYKLAVAREFRDEPAFYFPHNVDFRGRAYPMHPHLNHLGADICRGLLSFAQAKPLGDVGLYWLKVSVANLFGSGADKLPMDERAAFADEHMAQIMQTADNPLGPQTTWWLDADSPWQLLAVCMDIAAAVRSGDPRSYASRVPVHQDGSCNGLQHYAALGRDAWGGSAVNLTPSDRHQDVYTEVANLVRQRATKDAAAGNQWAPPLLDVLNRKLVKQTVMTSVYGVTFIGARQQISSRLKERGWTHDETIFRVSNYGAKVTLDSLMGMFSSAKDIMDWLTECARVIAAEDKPVQWVTPLGLPIVQPYRNMRKQAVKTVLQSVLLNKYTDGLPVMKSRQRSAFPPNYIHSIDSSHMMMTALACAQEGLAFAGVHDSFWTHAGDVPRMSQLLREQFVALHSQPLLEQLLASFKEQHPEAEFPPLPARGELDLNQVMDSMYFFS